MTRKYGPEPFKYKNITTPRLRMFYMNIMGIERRAYEAGDMELFNRCHFFNRELWEYFWTRA